MIETLVTAIHIIICLALILVILLQSGKGGGVSAAFGGGAGAALGQRGAATVLGKFTGVAAFIFMVTSMCLAIYSTPTARDRTLDDVDLPAQAPAVPAPGQETKTVVEEKTAPAPAAKPGETGSTEATEKAPKGTGLDSLKVKVAPASAPSDNAKPGPSDTPPADQE